MSGKLYLKVSGKPSFSTAFQSTLSFRSLDLLSPVCSGAQVYAEKSKKTKVPAEMGMNRANVSPGSSLDTSWSEHLVERVCSIGLWPGGT